MASPHLSRERMRVLAIIGLAALPLIAVEAFVLQDQQSSARETVAVSRLGLARSAALMADSYVEGNLSTLTALSQTPIVRSAASDAVNEVFRRILQRDKSWVTIGLSSADGWNISSLSAAPRTVNVSDREYFQEALAHPPGIGSVITTRGALRVKTIVLAVPVQFDDGARGVLSGALDLTRIDEQLREVVPSGAVELRVADRRGQEFIGPASGGDTLPDTSGLEEVKAALAGNSDSIVARDRAGREALVAYAGAQLPSWAVLLYEPTTTAFAVADQLVRTAVALTIVGIAAALLIGWYFSDRLARSYVEIAKGRARIDAERFRLHAALREAPARVGLLLGPDLVYAVATPRQLDQVGLTERDVLGKRYRDVDPDPSHRAVLEKVYRTGEPFEAKEMPASVRLPNGTVIDGYYDVTIIPTHDAGGAIDGVIYYANDVSDLVKGRKRLEELADTVRAERDELEQVINAMPEGVVVMRANGTVTRNRVADELLGRPFTADLESARRTFRSRHPDGRPYEIEEFPIVRALRGEHVRSEEVILRNPARDVDLNVLVSAAPVLSDGKIVAAVSVFQDITTLRAFERQRTEFFGMASHEIRTPVTAIQLQLDLALRQMAKGDSSRTQELVMKAKQRTKALTSLINDLLDVTRLDAGRLVLEPEAIDLAEVAGRTADEYPTDPEHPIIVLARDRALPVNADARRVVEVVENLLHNAVKYSPEGGTVLVEIGRDGDAAVVRVRDEGIGIPDAERAHIFDRFFRTSRAKPYGGVGLGLYISKEIVTQMGGTIELESSGEKGSVFKLSFPLAEVGAARA